MTGTVTRVTQKINKESVLVFGMFSISVSCHSYTVAFDPPPVIYFDDFFES